MARLAFLGTPEVAAGVLRALAGGGHDVAVVVTGADRRRGRGGALAPSPVKAAALELRLPVTDSPAAVPAADVELGVVVAYGRLLKPPLLGSVPLVNLHFSLLPRWRGAAPIERAILAGDAETGVCLMELEAGLDTGGVYERAVTTIDAEEHADVLRGRLAALGTEILLRRLAALPASLGTPEPQAGEPTYAAKVEPAELVLDWGRDAPSLARVVRIGRASTTWRGRRLLVHRARLIPAPPAAPAGSLIDGVAICGGGGGLELLEVQAEGKGAQSYRDWANGARPGPADMLGG